MIDFHLNFMNTSSKIEEKKKYKRISTSSFMVVFVFSLYVVGHIYFTQYYMVDAHRSRLNSLSTKLSRLEPRVKFLESKIIERNRLNSQLSDFLQLNDRPKVWVPRLMEIANLLPGDVILTNIRFNKGKKKKDPAMIIQGEHILKKTDQDYNFIDEMIINWSSSKALPEKFKSIKVLENNIIKEENDIKITFAIGFYLS